VNIHAKIGAGLLIIGALAAAGYRFVWPLIESRRQIDITDARGTKGRITIGVDNWIGYFPLCSDELRKRMRAAGYVVRCEDDKADYPKRFANLKDGQLQFAVATVDAYLLNGAGAAFPGAIVAVIDESKGGDALVAWKDKATSLESLKAARTPTIAFTPGSPSEYLLRSAAVHFDIAALRSGKGAWRVETNGSPDALKALLDRKVDAAVLWEPDVSRALAIDGVARLLSTADTQRLIVDVLMPGLNGIEVTSVVKNNLPAAKIVLFTMYDDAIRALAPVMGANALLTKSDGITALLRTVRTMLSDKVKNMEETLTRAVQERETDPVHLESLTRRAGVPLTRCSRDLKYLWVNKHYADWLQRPLEKIMGRPILDVLGKDAFKSLRHRFDAEHRSYRGHEKKNLKAKGAIHIRTRLSATARHAHQPHGATTL